MSANNSRYNYPIYIRKTSNNSDNETSFISNPNLTMRTTSSSSASIMSTPSNHIKRVQGQRQQNQEYGSNGQSNTLYGRNSKNKDLPFNSQSNASNKHHLRLKRTTNTNVKSKLLNLSKSSKRIFSVDNHEAINNNINQTLESFTTQKPTRSKFADYNQFIVPTREDYKRKTRKNSHGTEVGISRPDLFKSPSDAKSIIPIRKAQLDAWDSAQKITDYLIFDETSESSDEDNLSGNLIKSIPGYTENELDLITTRYNELHCRNNSNKIAINESYLEEWNKEEEKLIWELRQRHLVSQERIFAQYQSISDKRKVQITQKKEVLQRLFGKTNNLNQNFITNNVSTYSINNSHNLFQDDKEEIENLLQENESYKNSITEISKMIQASDNPSIQMNSKTKNSSQDIDYNKLQSIISETLNKSYQETIDTYNEDDNKISNKDKKIDEETKELQGIALAYLRNKVKEQSDEEVL